MTKTINRPKSSKKKAVAHTKCSICRLPGHNKTNCPVVPVKEQEKRLAIVAPSEKVVTVSPAMVGELLKKCKYTFCKNNVLPEVANAEFCSFTCEIFHKRQKLRSVRYKPEYAKQHLHKYLVRCEEGHRTTFVKQGDTIIPTRRIEVPSFAGFATFIGYSKVTLKKWSAQYDDFRRAMLLLKQIQEMYLLNNGVAGLYNSHISKLLLMNFHGMKDKSERTQNNMFGIIKEVYEKADSYEAEGMLEDPFAEYEEEENN